MIELAMFEGQQTPLLWAAVGLNLWVSLAWMAMARRVHEADPSGALGWLVGGSLVIGIGLWAGQAYALLSLELPYDALFDPLLIAASLVLCVGTAVVPLVLSLAKDLSLRQWVGGAAFTAAGLLASRLLAGKAMQVEPGPAWDANMLPWWLASAVVCAAALMHALRWRRQPARGRWVNRLHGLAIALAMTAVLCVTELAALRSLRYPAEATAYGAWTLSASLYGVVAGLSAVMVLTMTSVLSMLEQRFRRKADELRTTLRRSKRDLLRMAYADPLTELPNRTVFEERLDRAVERARDTRSGLALLFIDLDGFKPINDSFGHAWGDSVLREVGQRLRDVSRSGEMVARVGGDEFLMLLSNINEPSAVDSIAQRVIQAIGRPIHIGDREISISCSIGSVMYPEQSNHRKLIVCADAAMYMAKRAGGSSHVRYDPSFDLEREDSIDLTNDLRRAIEERRLELWYQPQIESTTRKITAVEALCRWRHPLKGMIGPDVFIPIAERSGMMGRLGNWVIDEACRQAAEWRASGLRMRVAINLSLAQMRQRDLVECILKSLDKYEVEPAQITCEITESVAMDDAQATQRVFKELGRAGLHLSIDDFGTGYSSLSYLRKLPAKELKIDRSFIDDLTTSADARAVVDAVVRLSHALGLRVVAEGVETVDQQEVLIELGCDRLQGFLYAKPMSARWIESWAMDAQPTQMQSFSDSIFVDDPHSGPQSIH